MNTGMLITSLYKNMLTIKIIEDKVYLNNELLVKKKILWRNHCRDIFINKEYVVKVVFDKKDDSSMDQNLLEYEKWKVISKTSDSTFFAPVMLCHKKGKFLVQERYYFTSHRRNDDVRNKIKSLCKKYDIGDVPHYENRNWAMIGKNMPIIYDYGSDEYWSE